MATLKNITTLLKSIEDNTALLVKEEEQIIEQTKFLVEQNEEQKLLLDSKQPKPDIPKNQNLNLTYHYQAVVQKCNNHYQK